MKFSKLVPNVFYADISDALKFFIDCLEFTITHNELKTHKRFCVIEKDGLRINLFQDRKYAEEHHPEFRLVTDDIQSVYTKISASHPEYLHPNLDKVTLRPWGAQEFALTDKQLCVVIQQW
ncbi:hypothetical protein [Dyadobacter fanqingshengii]|uniref:Uncharacterized protein n=1 Tax=Dyadobacter fanqingshengii TaxID=2906443 RepID=A0A9X1PDA8_9BACT|nr:hypothetical protein [Dyadobacter fanqingshengii]MCF0041520.1 hypothetical protein [Dyadobacter fanqingshengii]USJ36761.1 hypothetical protein NFI81_03100 [Dyadobacter fanqingshengii]